MNWVYGLINQVLCLICFAWIATEGLFQWRMSLRRMNLGLGDPVVSNRFLMWGLFGTSTTAMVAVLLGMSIARINTGTDVAGILTMAVFGVVSSAFAGLAFFPPESYLDRLRAAQTQAPPQCQSHGLISGSRTGSIGWVTCVCRAARTGAGDRVATTQFHGLMPAVREPALRPFLGIVAFASAATALTIGATLAPHVSFRAPGPDVVGWSTVNGYPIQQEVVFFALSQVGVPAAIALGVWLWALASRQIATVAGWHLDSTARLSAALSLVPTGLWWSTRDADPMRWPSPWLAFWAIVVAAAAIRFWPRTAAERPLPSHDRSFATGWRSRVISLLRNGLVPLGIYLLLFDAHLAPGLRGFDDGELLAPLNEVLRGAVPFRDVYIQHGLGVDIIVPWFGAKVFGATLEGVRFTEQLIAPLGAVAMYVLGLQVFRRRVLFATLLALLAASEHAAISHRFAFGLLSLSLVIRDAGREQRRMLGGAGALAGLAFWHSTDVGLYTLMATAAYLGLRALAGSGSFTALLSLGSGFALPIGVGAAVLLLFGALDDAVWNTWVQLRYQLMIWGLPFPPLRLWLDPLRDPGALGWSAFVSAAAFRAWLPIGVFSFAGGWLSYRAMGGAFWESRSCSGLLLIALMGAAVFRSALGRSDPQHVVYGSACLWLVMLFALDRLVDSAGRTRRAAPIAIAAAASLCVGSYAMAELRPVEAIVERMTRVAAARDAAPTLERAGNVEISAANVAHVNAVVAAIQQRTAPDEAIFDFSNQGVYYFFAQRRSATRYLAVAYAGTPAMQREITEALERAGTRLVILRSGGWFDAIDGVPNEQRHPIIARYLADHYIAAKNIKDTRILLRRTF